MRKEEYINEVISRIENKKARREVEKELSAHIDDRVSYYTDAGWDEQAATEKAMAHMGEPKEIGEQFAKLHIRTKPFKIIAISVALVFVILVVLGVVNEILRSSELKKTTIIYADEVKGYGGVVVGRSLISGYEKVLYWEKNVYFTVVGEYNGGDYCCGAIDSESNFANSIYLIKNKELYKKVYVSNYPEDVAASKDTVYYRCADNLYSVDIETGEEKLITDNIAENYGPYGPTRTLFLSHDGVLVYCENSNSDSDDPIYTDGFDSTSKYYGEYDLYAIKGGKAEKLCRATDTLGFVSDNVFVFQKYVMGEGYNINFEINLDTLKTKKSVKYAKCKTEIYLERDGRHFASFYYEPLSNNLFLVLNIKEKYLPFRYSTVGATDDNTVKTFVILKDY